jgi:hypothetical protein
VPGHRKRPLVGLVAEPPRPLAAHGLSGVVVVVEGPRRAAGLGGDVGDGRREDSLARDHRPGGHVDGGLRPPGPWVGNSAGRAADSVDT